MRFLAAALAAASAAATAHAGEGVTLKAAPADVYLYDASPRLGYVDLMVQTIAVANEGARPVELTGLQFHYRKEGSTRATTRVPPEDLAADTAEYAEMLAGGFDAFLRAQLLAPGGLDAFAGQGARLSPDASLGSREVILSTGNYAALNFEPDEVVVTAFYRSKGRTAKTSLTLKAARPVSTIGYAFPLDGAWLMRSLPSLQGHHRSIPSNEFALDFFKPGAEGRFAEGDSKTAENNFGYGAPVRAAAAGEVVFVIADAVQDRAALSRRDGETREEAGRRIQQYTMRRIAEDFRKALAGNLVTIKHEGTDGSLEYSSYGHLKAGSVRVKAGDAVAQGEIIGEVGDTGDSAAVHLHFQVNEGPDAFFSRSKPVAFSDMTETFSGQDPGIFVRGPER